MRDGRGSEFTDEAAEFKLGGGSNNVGASAANSSKGGASGAPPSRSDIAEVQPAMRTSQARFSLRRAMLGIAVISVLLGMTAWAYRNVPISYEEIPVRSGPAEYRAYHADGTFHEKGKMSGHWAREARSGRWVLKP